MKVKIRLWDILVGTLEWDKNAGKSVFRYSEEFLDSPYDISPTLYPKLDKRRAAFYGNKATEGLPEFLADSLPDDWGNTLFSKWASDNKIRMDESSALAKLSFIGKRAMGALEFEPELEKDTEIQEQIAIDELYVHAMDILHDREKAVLSPQEEKTKQRLIRLGTSIGGKHAKGLIAMDSSGNIRSGQIALPKEFRYYILKFKEEDEVPTSEIEKIYYDMATECGIPMMASQLYPASGTNHFLTERFDRLPAGEKVHTQTLKALSPTAKDYMNLFWLIDKLHVPAQRKETLFKQMVFNYFAGISDDHSKNFTFLMKKDGSWDLSPAYDLMFTSNIWNDPSAITHSLSVWGKNAYLTPEDFIDFGEDIGIHSSKTMINDIIEVIYSFPQRAQDMQIDKLWTNRIWKVIQKLIPAQRKGAIYETSRNDIKTILKEKYQEKQIEIIEEEILTTNGEESGILIHFTVGDKKRTCVTDNETGDICISPGFIKNGEFNFGTWKTLNGKPASYTQTRVMSLENKQKLKTN